MEIIQLDGAKLCRREEAFALLGEALALPGWWGRNLDALYDCLTGGLGRPVRLELTGREAMEATDFGGRLLRVLEDAAAHSGFFGLALEPEDGAGCQVAFSSEKK